MPRFAANLSMLFTEQDFLARFKAAADAGFSGVEYLFPYDFSAAEIKQQLDANGLTQVLFNLPAGDWAKGERGITCHPDRVEEFRAGVDKAIEYAKVLGNTQVNALAGIRPQGPDCATVRQTFVENLRYAADKLKAAGPRSIKFLCLLAAPEGIATLQAAHPDVPIYTAAIDRELNDHGYILPGLGDAGDRIFGTK